MNGRRLFLIPAAVLLVVGWYLFRPERLWVDSVVAESLEDAAAPGAPAGAGDMPIAVAQGSFHGVNHEGTGDATVYRNPGGARFLRFTAFSTSNGPDLYVYLVAASDVTDDETVKRAEYVSLGRLKGNRGDQNYVVPDEVDLSRYRTAVIWCRRFGVTFAVAPLTGV